MRYYFPLLFLFIFFIGTNNINAQNGTTPPVLIPPSPEASSLFKFVETPVNLNSGLANITVPIYTIQTKGVEIPISLNYHSRGIQVGELASRVGLGWTLNYGGMVSRQVRGKSDDGEAHGYLKESFYEDFFTNPETRSSVNQAYSNNNVDFDPDLFFFNFPGYSGKFIFDQITKDPWQQKYSDIIINPLRSFSTGIIKGFEIIDEKGNVFYFGAFDSEVSTTEVVGDKENAPGFWIKSDGVYDSMPSSAVSEGFSGWHLLKIVTYHKEVITFSYVPENPQYIRKSYDENLYESASEFAISYYAHVNNTQYQVSQIDFPGGKVIFNRESSQREDMLGAYALENIVIKNNANQEIKKFDFNYNVVTSEANNNYIGHLASTDLTSHKRMFLNSVTESSGNLIKPSYEFEYSPVKLPNRFSTSQDNWGYFNGANNGPFMPFYDYGDYTMDRRVNSTKNGAGLLRKVIYPTGGSVAYEYEQNIGVKPSFLDQTVSPGNNPEVLKEVLLGHLHSNHFESGYYTIPVIIGENKSSEVRSWVNFDYYDHMDGPCQDNESTAECRFSMILDGGPGKTYVLPFGNDKSLAGVPSGNYELKVYPPGGDSTIYFTTRLRWYEEDPVEDDQGNPLMLASGKRIKRITYSDGQAVVKYKEFEYQNPDGSNSGKIFGYPNFYAFKGTIGDEDIAWRYGSKPGSPLTSLQGNDLSYGYVIEYEGTKTDNIGKTEYKFTNFSDAGTYYEFPYHPPIDNQWLRGKPLETKVFQKNELGYSIVKEIKNQYIYGANESDINSASLIAYPPVLHMDSTFTSHHDWDYFRMPLAVFTPENGQQDGPDYKVFYQQGGASDLYSSMISDYLNNENGSQQVIKTTLYKYNYPEHYQVKEIEEVVDGKAIQTQYSYPNELEDETSLDYEDLDVPEWNGITTLKSANRIIPVQVKTLVIDESTTVSKLVERTLYKDQQPANITLPSEIKTAKLGYGLSSRLIYHEYDSKGNPLEISQADGPHTVYIWGYNNQYPVAKVENASHIDVVALINMSVINNPTTSDSSMRTELDKIRSGLPEAIVTTYTYKPLVGVTSETDPNGNTITYEYDDLGRLETVRNQDGKIAKHVKYEFKNQ